MTREEAIKALTMERKTALHENKQAFDMAIKALEQEPTTKNDCEHCAKTYGTLGCCDYVNNEPVYSCKEGHEEYARGIRKFGSTTKNDLAQERYQDLIEYFGGEDIVLKDRKEFKAWLERVKWHVKRADELARELEQIKGTTKSDLGVDWDELKRKILMEVDGGTDDAWLAYGEVCNRISNSIDKFVADMRGEEE